MKMKQDYLLLQKLERKDAKIIIPEVAGQSAKTKDIETFLVKEVGPGRWELGKLIPMDVEKGDIVFVTGFVTASKDGVAYTFGRARDVVSVF